MAHKGRDKGEPLKPTELLNRFAPHIGNDNAREQD